MQSKEISKISHMTTSENPFVNTVWTFLSSKVLVMKIEIGIECNIFRPWMFNPIFCFKECINLKHPNTFTLSNMWLQLHYFQQQKTCNRSYLEQNQTNFIFTCELLFSVNFGVIVEPHTSYRHIFCQWLGPMITLSLISTEPKPSENLVPRLLDFVVENLWKGKMNCSLLLFGVIGYVHASSHPHGGLILRF